jgi:ABC-type transport system involved in multi-copper enzyme maturation permease subunit
MTQLQLSQGLAVFRLEWKKSFFSRRGIWIYLLALIPLALFAAHTAVELRLGRPGDFAQDTNIFATAFQVFYVRLLVFFGCLGIFMNLFRGEMLDRSLHFYFLAPIRREVVLAGKFAAGISAAVVVFCTSTLLQFAAVYLRFDQSIRNDYLLNGHGMAHLGSYLATTALACLGYGAVFTVAGIRYRNPILPAAVILVWEGINGFLPPLVQKFSVIYYLKSLCPLEVSADVPEFFKVLVVNADRLPAAIAAFGILIVSLLLLTLGGVWLCHSTEISYAAE